MNRILMLLYGAIAYASFVGVFLYAIAFLNNAVVPKTIDSGPAGSIGTAILVNASILLLFVVQHTIMARAGFKAWSAKIVPKPIERSTYVLLASAILALLFWQWRPIPAIVWDVQHPVARTVLLVVQFSGFGIVLLSSFLIDHFDLFGLRQVVLAWRKRPYTQRPFVLRSLYRWVRHPLMLGFLIAFWAAPTMTAGHLLFSALTTGYIFFGTWIEERDLVRQHGAAYAQYRRTTPKLFPRLRVLRRPAPATDSADGWVDSGPRDPGPSTS